MLGFGLVVAGCAAFLPSTALPTLLPDEFIPTAIALTANALVEQTSVVESALSEAVTPMPGMLEVETPIFLDVTNTRSPAPAITATSNNISASTLIPVAKDEIPFADIQILRPGELSKVISPIPFHAYLVPGADKHAQVALFGEDGRVIYRQIFVFTDTGVPTHLRADIDFEIKAVAETVRLVVQTQDDRGRVLALASEDLILLSVGSADINPAGDLLESLYIASPTTRALIQGGVATITGWARVQPDQLLLVELIAADGRVLGSRLAGVASKEDGAHGLFSVEVPYQINAPTWARVTVTERGARIPGPVTVTSVHVLLSP